MKQISKIDKLRKEGKTDFPNFFIIDDQGTFIDEASDLKDAEKKVKEAFLMGDDRTEVSVCQIVAIYKPGSGVERIL